MIQKLSIKIFNIISNGAGGRWEHRSLLLAEAGGHDDKSTSIPDRCKQPRLRPCRWDSCSNGLSFHCFPAIQPSLFQPIDQPCQAGITTFYWNFIIAATVTLNLHCGPLEHSWDPSARSAIYALCSFGLSVTWSACVGEDIHSYLWTPHLFLHLWKDRFALVFLLLSFPVWLSEPGCNGLKSCRILLPSFLWLIFLVQQLIGCLLSFCECRHFTSTCIESVNSHVESGEWAWV